MNIEIDDTLMNISDSGPMDCTPIHKFAAKYDIIHSLANRLIGNTEDETEDNIRIISEAIEKYAQKRSIAVIKKADENADPFGHWNAPYGYKKSVNGELIKVPNEQKVIRFIRKSRKKGLMIIEIAERLSNAGLKTRRGSSEWQSGVIVRIIKRESDK